MHSAGFEPTIPVAKRPQTYTLDGAAIQIGECLDSTSKLVQHRFLPNLFRFIIYLSPFLWRYAILVTF
jgi:hypothetical protein